MNRRTFISTTSAAAIGVGASSLVSIRSQGKQPMPTSPKTFWPDKARLVISVSMQFETGAQPERGAGSPFPPIDSKYPDLPAQKWYDYGFKEGIPRLLNFCDMSAVNSTSPLLVHPSQNH